MSTGATNLNRIPLNVNHSQESQQSRFSREYRSSSSSNINNNTQTHDNYQKIYDMRDMHDETDRIKSRMREFEDRCKKWREEFFTRSSLMNDPFQLDQRVPFTAKSSSTMHRSYIEDLPDGVGKRYRIEFDIGDFKQNELQLSTNDRNLIVRGDRELKAGSATETKTFNRELTLPDYVDINNMTAFLIDKSPDFDPASQIVSINNTVNYVLVVEAPILMDKYSYRRSAFDNSQSPIRINSPAIKVVKTNSPVKNKQTVSESHQENQTTTTSTHSVSRVVHSPVNQYDLNISEEDALANFKKTNLTSSNLNLNTSLTPELLSGYPVYDNTEGCVVYKFNLSGFDQSEINLTITVDRTLEIRACKEQVDHLGKVYREFKREIALEPEVDANLIKNVLHEGILTLKIPKANRADGLGSISNNHNLQTPNGFKEIYNDDGKLAKLNADFRGYNPENVKIVLSANNILKVTAQQVESSPGHKGTVQKECSRQYTLPGWIQPENMRATMSRDGILTIDFTSNQTKSSISAEENLNMN